MSLKKIVAALLSISAVLAAVPGRAQEPLEGLEKFHADGMGTLSGTLSAPNDTVTETATLRGRFIGRGATLTFQLSNGLSGWNGTAAECAFKSGTATITSTNTSTITMSLAGVGCNAPGNVNATGVTYVVTGGTKDFDGAKGTGRLSWSEDLASGVILISIDGNLLRPYRPREDEQGQNRDSHRGWRGR
jgi:hypothetical protein